MGKYDFNSGAYVTQRGETLTPPTCNPVLTVAGAYASGDYVGTSGVAMIFDGCALDDGLGGLLIGADVIDASGATGVSMELWMSTVAITPPVDNAAWSISDADALSIIAVIPIYTFYASALNNRGAGAPTFAKSYKCADGSRKLYGCLVTRGAPTLTSLDLTVIPSIIPN